MAYRSGAQVPPSPPSFGGVHRGSEINFFLGRRHLVTEIYFQSPDGKCGRQIRSIKFFLLSETQQRESFQDVSSQENIPLLNDRKSQIPRVKALKYRVAYNLVEMSFRQIDSSLSWRLNVTFSFYMSITLRGL